LKIRREENRGVKFDAFDRPYVEEFMTGEKGERSFFLQEYAFYFFHKREEWGY